MAHQIHKRSYKDGSYDPLFFKLNQLCQLLTFNLPFNEICIQILNCKEVRAHKELFYIFVPDLLKKNYER